MHALAIMPTQNSQMNNLKRIFGTTAIFYLCIFFSFANFAQVASQKKIPKDWFEKDPNTDSVAGISLDKAYQLLKGRKSKTVIVAVIDNTLIFLKCPSAITVHCKQCRNNLLKRVIRYWTCNSQKKIIITEKYLC